MVTLQETLSSVLQRHAGASGAQGAALITRDGLPLVSSLPPHVERETFAAMLATMLGAAETAGAELETAGDTRLTFVHGRYLVAAAGAGPELLVVLVADGGIDADGLAAAAVALAADVRQAS